MRGVNGSEREGIMRCSESVTKRGSLFLRHRIQALVTRLYSTSFGSQPTWRARYHVLSLLVRSCIG
jgi:hypothetical protein